jgi:hypothetical protein
MPSASDRAVAVGVANRDELFNFHGKSVHQWQRYIPLELRAEWATLGDEARGVAQIIGQELADMEEWD